ncbi:type II toxin-antitoxin system VapC family toxin [Zavarzinia sp.]|uniref:type II toxin-antitoxin system VapC family toxin n=1 Tax=Zavarzinia sp. TaxID=2027920 RepID=UPI00356443FD
MLAIDANIVVRYLTGDHPQQSATARALIDGEDVFVGVTVLLESDWVLRSAYGFAAVDVARALRAFAGLPRVTVEAPASVALALDRTERGMDFADALHLGLAVHCDGFATFDRRLAATARAAGDTKVRLC